MVKIKQKKQLNLPQLIEWIEINRRFDESFGGDRYNYVHANVDGILEFTGKFCEDTFTVTTEEEIDEDTVLPILIERRDFGNELTYSRYEYVRIKDIKEESSTLFYIENDDKSLTLIWRDGKLVE
ncbi:hypothetical protein CD120_01090 [Staphylococcus saprophyticus]|uniref:hypothetical protein n=1 Tax=Staphylococcus saprophyticus TaxID=29385 RepID=UPI000CD056DA|nr:hypothetical protein [Staphylococcus saprophyticus]PNZ75008.1 hypothetical protein CD120_01090 [Staphylococcus saprophyticus]